MKRRRTSAGREAGAAAGAPAPAGAGGSRARRAGERAAAAAEDGRRRAPADDRTPPAPPAPRTWLGPFATLAPLGRFLGALVAWLAYFAASPGVLHPDGSTLLAVLAVATWAAVEARPHRGPAWRGFLAHALGAAPGAALVLEWIRYVFWPPLLWIGFGYGVYSAYGGVLLRALRPPATGERARPRLPLPLAVALAWTGMEALRALVPMPLGLPWLRLGHFPSDVPAIAGSARVVGIEGLTFAVAALAGLAATAVVARPRLLRPAHLAAGLAPLALALLLAALVPPPATVPGPRVLLVQPGFPQERKQHDDPARNFADSLALTRSGAREVAARGEPPPDLVCWGESMLYVDFFDEPVPAVLARPPAEGAPRRPTPEHVELFAEYEEVWVRRRLFGLWPGAAEPLPTAAVPPGASFLSGAIVWVLAGGVPRRHNAVVLFGPDGERRPEHGAKRYLVPGAETMYGLEALPLVRRAIDAIAGYVPDFLAGEETGVLELETRDGRRYAFGATVCFDNAFLEPYVDPLREREVDFFVVVSNEAWYRESFEVDQMIAFSRLAAIASGRTLVRATNSGISAVVGPDGRVRERLVVGGRDRLVGGTLAAVVPVPAEGAGGPTPYARVRPLVAGAAAGLPPLLAAALVLARRRARPAARAGAATST